MLVRRSFVFTAATVLMAVLLVGYSSSVSQGDEAARTFSQKVEVAKSIAKDEVPVAVAAQQASAPRSKLNEGPQPTWIWGANPNKKYFLRKEFPAGAKAAWVKASSDNHMVVRLNGQVILRGNNWQTPTEDDATAHLKGEKNVLVAEVSNDGGIAAFVLKMALLLPDGKIEYVVSDETWQASEDKNGKDGAAVTLHGKLGVNPWGDVFSAPSLASSTPRDVFQTLPGFQVERIFTVPKDKLGSWVNITSDNKGRLIVSDQGNLGLCRITPAPIGSNGETKVEHLDVKFEGKQVSGAQGLLWAFDSLYVCCNGGPGSGLYRLKDTNGDDQFDRVEKLRDIPGGGEHGPHALRLSPDGKSIFVDAGNHTKLPFEVKTNAPPQTMAGVRTEQLRATLPEGVTSRIAPNWDEDLLLPRQWDAGGHAVGILAPGGWIARTDPDGKTWEVFTVGYRNQFDFAFNADGEIFVYDADMEWDFGTPWYRPTRVVHATSGSEFGWRSGTGKWPTSYVDSLPELVNIGPGSPVGVEFGYGTKFPAKYQKALFICDWTFATMYAIHIEPNGASYKAVKEEFVSRTPLPLTDCTVGKDGALYFTIGGRGADSELFRVTYIGSESTAPVDARDPRHADLRALRHKIEGFHSDKADGAQAVPFCLPLLGHADRHIRYAARVALERQPLNLWQDKVLTSNDPNTLITGVVGLARQGEPAIQLQLLTALDKLDFGKLSEEQQAGLLRAFQLVFIRLGAPEKEVGEKYGVKFQTLFPTQSDALNRELANLMIFLQAPQAASKLVPLLTKERVGGKAEPAELLARNSGYGSAVAAVNANPPDLQQVHYAFALRNLKAGWSPEQRQTYFAWFKKGMQWSGGNSYKKFLVNIENDAFANATDIERLAIVASGAREPYKAPELPKPTGPGRDYNLADMLSLAETGLKGRNFKNGEKMFAAARCIVCHRFSGDGGATGPDLTQLAGRFNVKDLSEAIVDPSKVVSDQYKASTVVTTDGKILTGRILSETKDDITLLLDPEDATKVQKILRKNIDELNASTTSLMPKDLLKQLNEKEVLDLLAYLLSRGNKNDPVFGK